MENNENKEQTFTNNSLSEPTDANLSSKSQPPASPFLTSLQNDKSTSVENWYYQKDKQNYYGSFETNQNDENSPKHHSVKSYSFSSSKQERAHPKNSSHSIPDNSEIDHRSKNASPGLFKDHGYDINYKNKDYYSRDVPDGSYNDYQKKSSDKGDQYERYDRHNKYDRYEKYGKATRQSSPSRYKKYSKNSDYERDYYKYNNNDTNDYHNIKNRQNDDYEHQSELNNCDRQQQTTTDLNEPDCTGLSGAKINENDNALKSQQSIILSVSNQKFEDDRVFKKQESVNTDNCGNKDLDRTSAATKIDYNKKLTPVLTNSETISNSNLEVDDEIEDGEIEGLDDDITEQPSTLDHSQNYLTKHKSPDNFDRNYKTEEYYSRKRGYDSNNKYYKDSYYRRDDSHYTDRYYSSKKSYNYTRNEYEDRDSKYSYSTYKTDKFADIQSDSLNKINDSSNILHRDDNDGRNTPISAKEGSERLNLEHTGSDNLTSYNSETKNHENHKNYSSKENLVDANKNDDYTKKYNSKDSYSDKYTRDSLNNHESKYYNKYDSDRRGYRYNYQSNKDYDRGYSNKYSHGFDTDRSREVDSDKPVYYTKNYPIEKLEHKYNNFPFGKYKQDEIDNSLQTSSNKSDINFTEKNLSDKLPNNKDPFLSKSEIGIHSNKSPTEYPNTKSREEVKDFELTNLDNVSRHDKEEPRDNYYKRDSESERYEYNKKSSYNSKNFVKNDSYYSSYNSRHDDRDKNYNSYGKKRRYDFDKDYYKSKDDYSRYENSDELYRSKTEKTEGSLYKSDYSYNKNCDSEVYSHEYTKKSKRHSNDYKYNYETSSTRYNKGYINTETDKDIRYTSDAKIKSSSPGGAVSAVNLEADFKNRDAKFESPKCLDNSKTSTISKRRVRSPSPVDFMGKPYSEYYISDASETNDIKSTRFDMMSSYSNNTDSSLNKKPVPIYNTTVYLDAKTEQSTTDNLAKDDSHKVILDCSKITESVSEKRTINKENQTSDNSDSNKITNFLENRYKDRNLSDEDDLLSKIDVVKPIIEETSKINEELSCSNTAEIDYNKCELLSDKQDSKEPLTGKSGLNINTFTEILDHGAHNTQNTFNKTDKSSSLEKSNIFSNPPIKEFDDILTQKTINPKPESVITSNELQTLNKSPNSNSSADAMSVESENYNNNLDNTQTDFEDINHKDDNNSLSKTVDKLPENIHDFQKEDYNHSRSDINSTYSNLTQSSCIQDHNTNHLSSNYAENQMDAETKDEAKYKQNVFDNRFINQDNTFDSMQSDKNKSEKLARLDASATKSVNDYYYPKNNYNMDSRQSSDSQPLNPKPNPENYKNNYNSSSKNYNYRSNNGSYSGQQSFSNYTSGNESYAGHNYNTRKDEYNSNNQYPQTTYRHGTNKVTSNYSTNSHEKPYYSNQRFSHSFDSSPGSNDSQAKPQKQSAQEYKPKYKLLDSKFVDDYNIREKYNSYSDQPYESTGNDDRYGHKNDNNFTSFNRCGNSSHSDVKEWKFPANNNVDDFRNTEMQRVYSENQVDFQPENSTKYNYRKSSQSIQSDNKLLLEIKNNCNQNKSSEKNQNIPYILSNNENIESINSNKEHLSNPKISHEHALETNVQYHLDKYQKQPQNTSIFTKDNYLGQMQMARQLSHSIDFAHTIFEQYMVDTEQFENNMRTLTENEIKNSTKSRDSAFELALANWEVQRIDDQATLARIQIEKVDSFASFH
ncbi:hypothetical protein BB561_000271 [Smittium simulii]|uniref:Uncharacterized protein n=1 Tax=Smittium simulii TaxID=133385 RepID=A0A2T9YZV9_9FUNG|nr:hypothetical protein BB561_000271 [Smittium simulii]